MTSGPPDEQFPPRRRRHRRATGGVPAPDGGAPGSPDPGGGPAEPLLPGRSADDEDTGWGEGPEGNDDRLLRDVPPHW